jgi:hypothetical protein
MLPILNFFGFVIDQGAQCSVALQEDAVTTLTALGTVEPVELPVPATAVGLVPAPDTESSTSRTTPTFAPHAVNAASSPTMQAAPIRRVNASSVDLMPMPPPDRSAKICQRNDYRPRGRDT